MASEAGPARAGKDENMPVGSDPSYEYEVPAEPADAGSTSYEPGSFEPSSDPPHGSTPDAGATLSGEEQQLPEFDPRWRDAFTGLLYIGKLEKNFTWCGHRFKIKTLDTDTLLQVGLLHKRYEATFGEVKALQAAMLAGALVSIDGQGMPLPISSAVEELDEKFHWVCKLYPWTLDKLYEEWLLLDNLVQQVIEAMGKAVGSDDSTGGSNAPFASLNDAGFLEQASP